MAPSGPTISKREPASGVTGVQVALTGMGFAAAATDNVPFNGIVAEIKDRTLTPRRRPLANAVRTPPCAQ